MKKFVVILLSICMIFTVASIGFVCTEHENDSVSSSTNTPQKAKLELKEDVWITHRKNGGYDIKGFINFLSEDEKSNTEVVAQSNDETIVYVDRGCLWTGDKFGKTQVELSTEDKVATLEVEVISCSKYLYRERQKGKKEEAYFFCAWLKNGIDGFKSPDSVEVLESEDVIAHVSESGGIDYFLAQIRAQNSYGGYTTDWVMVDPLGVSEGFSPYFYHFLLDGFVRAWGVGDYANIVLEEYRMGIV